MNVAKKLIRKYPKTLILISVIVGYIYLLPSIISIASLLYFKDWQVNAEKSAKQIAADEPFCIAAKLPGHGFYVPKSFAEMDIKAVIEEEVRWKLRYFDFRLGEENGLRMYRGIHFGIIKGNKLYYWSFMKQAFFDAEAHYYNSRSAWQSLKISKLIIQRGQAAKSAVTDLPEQVTSGQSTYKAASSMGAEEQQFQWIMQMKDIQSYYQDWLNKVQKTHPKLTPDDFICPHI